MKHLVLVIIYSLFLVNVQSFSQHINMFPQIRDGVKQIVEYEFGMGGSKEREIIYDYNEKGQLVHYTSEDNLYKVDIEYDYQDHSKLVETIFKYQIGQEKKQGKKLTKEIISNTNNETLIGIGIEKDFPIGEYNGEDFLIEETVSIKLDTLKLGISTELSTESIFDRLVLSKIYPSDKEFKKGIFIYIYNINKKLYELSRVKLQTNSTDDKYEIIYGTFWKEENLIQYQDWSVFNKKDEKILTKSIETAYSSPEITYKYSDRDNKGNWKLKQRYYGKELTTSSKLEIEYYTQ